MADAVKISLEGFGELEAALRTIGPRAVRSVGAKALRLAAKPIVDMGKALAPVLTGELEDSIIAVMQRSPRQNELMLAIGFTKQTSWRAHFTEFGTQHSAAKPFMRPALDSQAMNAIAIMGAEMWKGIEAEANKAKKGKK